MQGPNKSICSKLNSGFLRKWWIVVIISIGLIIFGGIVALFFRSWVNLFIDSEIILREHSQTFNWWRKPPVHPIISVYVYNVTNADEFLNNGEKPKIDELGPYVYRETWEKVNLQFHGNGTVSFQQRKVYHFVEELSNGFDEDLVVVPNIPMLSATSQSKHAARFLRLAMASIMEILKVRPFVEVSVKQLLWGYEDPLLKLAKDVVPKEQKLPYLEFGLMYGKNGTSPDRVSVFTGADGVEQYGLIDRFNGQMKLPHWKTEECNRINGSDGSIFPPHMTKDTILNVFDKDICRILPLVFQEEVISKGEVKAFRFSPPENVFADIERNPDNECFCPSGPPCAPHGFFNVSVCQFDSPILLSFPHFYLADEKYREAVEGISPPDPEKHKFFIDVQPEMGTALAARARIQINLAVSQVIDIKQVASFPNIVFPIMWFEEGMDGLPSEVTDLLRLATDAPPVARAVLMYGLFGLGVLLLFLAISCLVRSVSRQETLTLAASNHYIKSEKPQQQNGIQKTMETLNPAFENPQH